MKYVIEIEDEPFGRNDDPVIPHGMDELYRAKGFNALVFDKNGLDKLIPIDKELEEAYQMGLHTGESKCEYCDQYKCGLEAAWDAAKKLALMDAETSENVTGYFGLFRIMENLTPMQAIEKLKAYEEQKANEIKVGEEVEAFSGRAIVFGTFTDTKGEKFCRYWYPSDDSFNKDKTENLKKTGRYFPQVEELIKAIKEGAE